MTRSIADAVAELKSSVRQSLDPNMIQRVCVQAGHTWRDRVLDPVTTIWLFTLQIVHCNTACDHVVRLLPGIKCTGNAYGQARSRIPLAAFHALFRMVTRRLLESIDHALDRWHGHRVFFIDGSSCSMPDKGGSETTGALDTNADSDDLKYTAANVEGRIAITASWYDRFGRVTDTVAYGTYGGSDFDRDGLSVPARSDTALLTEYEFNTDGSLKSATDPRDLETRYSYDDAGRKVAVISNYVNGTPSSSTGDDDNFVRYVYTDGLQTKMWVDLDGDDTEDATDQVTTYTFGTTKGATAGDSKIGTGHLLQKITYPDSGGASDVVTFAYNAQGQEIYKSDQDGNVIETNFDVSGRVTHKRATTIDADFDDAVKRISTAYDNLGRVQTVTQYDNATVDSGSVVDEVKYTYSDWGPVEKFEQDHDSTVATGGDYLYDVDFAYAKATTGRNTIRRATMDLPDGTTATFNYLSTGDLHDAETSRVSEIEISSTALVTYDYNGASQVVGRTYPEPDVMSNQYGTTSGSYPDLDRFGRVTTSKWTKDLATDVDFYDQDVTYDRNSNITLGEDNVHVGFDVEYSIDDLNRLTNAEEGTWNGSSITSTTREQEWTELCQVGNWERVKLDLDGDGVYTGTGEYDDNRTHNVANEITQYAPTPTNRYPDYDGPGNLTDEKENYEFVFDVFGRLRKIQDTDDQSLIVEHVYNGLGYRISWHYDVDGDGSVETNGDDPEYHFVYDTQWRITGTYRTDDSDPKELFVYHNAGSDGLGGGSYIDDVAFREKDANTDWDAESDGTLEDRVYYCQNWRHDVVVLIDDGGEQVEMDRYSPYGVGFGLPAGDCDSDGDVDATDLTTFDGWMSYDVRGDTDLDGDNDVNDRGDISRYSGNTLGWGALSLVGNRKAYAGYELDDAVESIGRMYHVRHRVLHSDFGRWLTRDPLGYLDGASLYGYAATGPVARVDPLGLKGGVVVYPYRCEGKPRVFGAGDELGEILLECEPPRDGGSGQSPCTCEIQVCCNAMFSPEFPIFEHCYIKFLCTDSGSPEVPWICSGGSERLPLGSGFRKRGDGDTLPDACRGRIGGWWGALNTWCGPQIDASLDEDGDHPTTNCTTVDVNVPCERRNCIMDRVLAIENCCVPYDPFFGPNSNSLVYDALTSCQIIVQNVSRTAGYLGYPGVRGFGAVGWGQMVECP